MNPTLISKLKHLRLSGIAEALAVRVAQAEAAPLPHLEFLELLVEDELHRRADRLFGRRLKQGEIVQLKELKDFDWVSTELGEGHKYLSSYQDEPNKPDQPSEPVED